MAACTRRKTWRWPFVPLAGRTARSRNSLPGDPATPPDRAFEKLWELTMLDQVLSRLRTEFSATVDKLGFDPCSVFGCYRAKRRLKPMHVSDGIGRCLDSERLEQNPLR